MSEQLHAIVYDTQQGVWEHIDHFGEIIGLHNNKAEAKDAAKRFAKDRAAATGGKVVLSIETKTGGIEQKLEYG